MLRGKHNAARDRARAQQRALERSITNGSQPFLTKNTTTILGTMHSWLGTTGGFKNGVIVQPILKSVDNSVHTHITNSGNNSSFSYNSNSKISTVTTTTTTTGSLGSGGGRPSKRQEKTNFMDLTLAGDSDDPDLLSAQNLASAKIEKHIMRTDKEKEAQVNLFKKLQKEYTEEGDTQPTVRALAKMKELNNNTDMRSNLSQWAEKLAKKELGIAPPVDGRKADPAFENIN